MTTEWEYATLLISEPSKLDAAVAELQQRRDKCRQKQLWAHERVAGGLRFQYPTPKPQGTYRKLAKDNIPSFDIGAISAALVGPDGNPGGAKAQAGAARPAGRIP